MPNIGYVEDLVLSASYLWFLVDTRFEYLDRQGCTPVVRPRQGVGGNAHMQECYQDLLGSSLASLRAYPDPPSLGSFTSWEYKLHLPYRLYEMVFGVRVR